MQPNTDITDWIKNRIKYYDERHGPFISWDDKVADGTRCRALKEVLDYIEAREEPTSNSILTVNPENPWWHLKGQECSVVFNLPLDKWPLTPSPGWATILDFNEDSVLLECMWKKSVPFWCARKYIESINDIPNYKTT